MNINDLIEECITDLDTKRISLSQTIMKCIRISHKINDVESLLILESETFGTMDKQVNERFLEKMRVKFIENGFNENEFKLKYQEMTRDYIVRRTNIDINIQTGKTKEVIMAQSIAEIESTLENIRLTIEKNTIPDGLHSLDVYKKNSESQLINNILISKLDSHHKILDRTRTKLYEILINLESKIGKNSIQNIGPTNNRNIFIIHGHDEAKWRELQKYLKEDFGLNPIILSEQPDKGMTIIEKFEYYANQCCYAFAMFTPDDIIDNNEIKYFQARPNVIFELGWFCSYLGRDRVCILYKDGKEMSIFSDFQGVIQKRFINSISEVYRDIKLELNSAGIM